MKDVKRLVYEENKVLSENLNLISKEIAKNDEIIKNHSSSDINAYKKVDNFKYERAVKDKNKLLRIMDDPYFGRMDLYYEDEHEKETIYIGKKGLEIDDNTIIISWAAPIADIYNKYDKGVFKEIYSEDNGKKRSIEGEIIGKRRISIKNRKVIDVYDFIDSTKESKDEFIRDRINENRTDKLGVIIETVQKEQNDIIRLPIEKNVVVQGCAGSGKSSVAFHRLAYLAYNYSLKDSELLVISPNKVFKGYTSTILMELGSDFNVKQYTFKEFAEVVLKTKIKDKIVVNNEKNQRISKLKTSSEFKLILDKYIKYLEDTFIPEDNIFIDEFEFINSSEIKEIWQKQFSTYKINDRIDGFKMYLQNKLKDKSKKYIENLEDSYIKNLKTLNKYNKSPITYNEIRKLYNDEIVIKKKRLEKQFTAIMNGYLNKLEKINAINVYNNLLKDEQLLRNLAKDTINDEDINNILENTEFTEIDSIPATYLYFMLNENVNKYRHIVIDECQDLSYIEVSILESLTTSFTLVGDFNQRINTNKSIVSLDDLSTIFNKYTFFDNYYLNKSFRNSKSITKYSNAILNPYFVNQKSIPVSFNRETEKPKVYLNMNEERTIEDIVKSINNKNYNDRNIAIILKDEEEARRYYKRLSKLLNGISINLIDNEYCNYKKGINVVSCRLSKGLEFDYVIIAAAHEYEDNEEDKRLLYIAATRALHELEIYTERRNCFITSIDEELWECKFKYTTSNLVKNFQNSLVNDLIESFGELCDEYKEYIYSIDNISKLTEFAESLEGIENIDEIFKKNKI